MQIPILGLLMSALIAIPILVSILYRFWSAIPFILIVGLLAVMPWLALTLLGSCILASVRPFRTRFRFMSALVGLVPIVVYLILAWRGSNDMIVGHIDPIDRIKFIAPWVLAIVAAGTVFALVLTIARIVDYRPGAITPLLALLFGLPVALFEYNVGRDELYYRLLEARAEAHFADIDASRASRERARRLWENLPLPRPSWAALQELAEKQWLFELANDLGPYQTALKQYQQELTNACDQFINYYPDSRYAPNALYIKARALSMRIDTREFRANKFIRFYADFPDVASRESWRTILHNKPNSPLAAEAGLRLAQLNARDCYIERAIDQLTNVIARFDATHAASATGPTTSALGGVLARGEPEDSLRIPLPQVLLDAHRLHELLTRNRDPIYGYEPICGPPTRRNGTSFGLLDLDPRNERYAEKLKSLRDRYARAQIQDNIALELAKTAPTSQERIRRLEDVLKKFPDGDAAPEAMFRLAVEYRTANRVAQGHQIFTQLAQRFPDSAWTSQALRQSPSLLAMRMAELAP